MHRLGASAELGEAARIFDFRPARRVAAAGILAAIGWMTPTGASAQFDEVLRNVMQNAMHRFRSPKPAYPPGHPPTRYGAGAAFRDSGPHNGR